VTSVAVRGAGGLAQTIVIGEHRLTADEPASAGGGDTGPTPYELLLGALGACTAMTVRLYAARHGWALDDVEVSLSHSRIHAEDCAECETREGFLDQIDKRLVLRGSLTHEQRARLAEIAERCPVQRTLQREVVVHQELVNA
jgi:putative redox protein